MTNKATQTISFEEALSELESIVSRMESGEMTLEATLEAYTRGTELTKLCQSKLDAAQAKITQLTAQDTLKPLDVPVTDETIPF